MDCILLSHNCIRKRPLFVITVIFLPFILLGCAARSSNFPASSYYPLSEHIIRFAESFFLDLKESKYLSVWQKLTYKSKKTIIADIIKKSSPTTITEDELSADFSKGGDISKIYWSAFVENCDPDLPLKHSTWEAVKIQESYAEIKLVFKKSDRPAILRLYKEGGEWKVGLVESFWTRKQSF